MSLPIYQRVAVTDAGDVIPGAEYTVINENTGVAAPIYSDRTGATLLTAPYFADSAGTIQFFIAQGTTFRVAASGGVGTYTDRYVYGVAEAVLVQADGNVGIGTSSPSQAKLEVLAESDYSSHTGHGISIVSNANDVYTGMYMGTDDTINAAYIQSAGINFSFTSKKLLLNPNGGNVGIGTNSPAQKLQVSGNSFLQYQSGATNNTAPTTLTVSNLTTGAHAAGLGASLLFNHVNSGGGYNGPKISSVSNADPFTSNLVFYSQNYAHSEAMRLDSAGNLLVGKTSSSGADINVVGNVLKPTGANYFTALSSFNIFNRLTTDGDILDFRKDGTSAGAVGVSGGNNLYISGTAANHAGLTFATQQILPTTQTAINNNVVDLGNAGNRFKDIYLTNAPIVTSDRNEKQDIEEITTAETAVAKVCKGLMRSFRLKSAVEEKGDDARIHFGIIAQDLQDAFTAEGLDAGRYAMFISTTWWETQTEVAAVEAAEAIEGVQFVEASEALYSEDGELISEAVEAVEGVEAVEAVEAKDAYTRTDTFQTLAEAPEGATERTQMGVRYTELLAFIIAAL